MGHVKKHVCLICGREAAESQFPPLQCLHCGGLGFFSLFLAPHTPPLPPNLAEGDSSGDDTEDWNDLAAVTVSPSREALRELPQPRR